MDGIRKQAIILAAALPTVPAGPMGMQAWGKSWAVDAPHGECAMRVGGEPMTDVTMSPSYGSPSKGKPAAHDRRAGSRSGANPVTAR